MQVLKHILLDGWYHRGLIVHQQRYQPSVVKHNQYTLTALKIKHCHSKFRYIALITLSRTWFSKLVNKINYSLHHSVMVLLCYISCHYCFFTLYTNLNVNMSKYWINAFYWTNPDVTTKYNQLPWTYAIDRIRESQEKNMLSSMYEHVITYYWNSLKLTHQFNVTIVQM